MTLPTYANSAARCIHFALEDAGLIQEGGTPTGEQYARGLHRLNDLIALWQTRGLKVWLQEERTVTLVAAQAAYTVTGSNSERAMRVLEGWYQDSNANKTPLTPLSREEYSRISPVTTASTPSNYWAEKTPTALVVSLWPVPSAAVASAGSVRLIVQRKTTTIVSVTDSTAFPSEWFLALRWGLADELATGQPVAIMDRCMRKAQMFLAALEEWDVEDAPTRFIPDAGGRVSRFR